MLDMPVLRSVEGVPEPGHNSVRNLMGTLFGTSLQFIESIWRQAIEGPWACEVPLLANEAAFSGKLLSRGT